MVDEVLQPLTQVRNPRVVDGLHARERLLCVVKGDAVENCLRVLGHGYTILKQKGGAPMAVLAATAVPAKQRPLIGVDPTTCLATQIAGSDHFLEQRAWTVLAVVVFSDVDVHDGEADI